MSNFLTSEKIEKAGIRRFMFYLVLIYVAGLVLDGIFGTQLPQGLAPVVGWMAYIAYLVLEFTKQDKENLVSLLSQRDGEIMEYSQMLQKASQMVKKLQSEMTQLRTEATEVFAKSQQDSALLVSLRKDYALLKQDRDSLHDSVMKVVAERDVLKQKAEPLFDSNHVLKQDNEALREDLKRNNTNLDMLQRENASLTYKLEEQNRNVAQLNEEIERIKKSHAGTISALTKKFNAQKELEEV